MSDSNGNDPYGPPSDPNPYGPPPSEPSSTPSYGEPQFNPTSVPQYGTPYSNAPYGGSPYGAPTGPVTTDGMSIAAMVASILGFCTCIGFIVGIVLGIIGLGRTKDGKANGRGFAIAGLAIGAVGIVLSIVVVVALIIIGVNQSVTPSNAKVGQCINVDDKDGNKVAFTKESCTDDHDGEIVGVAKVTNANRDQAGASSFCSTIVSTATQAKLAARSEDLKYEWATENPDDVKVGDHIVCYVRSDTKLKDDVLK